MRDLLDDQFIEVQEVIPLIDRNKGFNMFKESRKAKVLRIISNFGVYAIAGAFFIFLMKNWQWMVDHNGKLFTVAMLLLDLTILTANTMFILNFNPYQWIRDMIDKRKKN